jgi:GNAT superfamily N-acetyltransferase
MIPLPTESSFLCGPGRPESALDIDRVFGKSLDRVLSDLRTEGLEHLLCDEGLASTQSIRVPDLSFREVQAGLLLIDSEGAVVGGYISCDLVLAESYRGRGLGAEIVAEYFARYQGLPTWSLDAPAYSPAGLAAHRSAYRLLKSGEVPMMRLQRERRSSGPSRKPKP